MGGDEVIKRRGLVKKHAAVDYEVWQWKTNLEQSRGPQRVTKTEVQTFAKEAYKRAGVASFKASDGWYRRWRVRWQNPGILRNSSVEVKGKTDDESKSIVKSGVKTNIKKVSRKRKISNCESEVMKRKKTDQKIVKTKGTFPSILKRSFQSVAGEKDSQLFNLTENIDEWLEGKVNSYSDLPNVLGLVRVQSSNQNDLFETETESLILNNNSSFEMIKDPFELESKITVGSVDKSTAIVNSTSKITGDTSPCYLDGTCNIGLTVSGSLQKGSVTEPTDLDTTQINRTTETLAETLPGVPNVEIVLIEPENPNQEILNTLINQTTNEKEADADGCDALWTVRNDPQREMISSQSDSGISLGSVSLETETLYSIVSPLFDQNDDEVFCNTCEDFHPWNQSTRCSQRKRTVDNSLLSFVVQKKDITTSKPSEGSSVTSDTMSERVNTIESEDRLENPDVVLLKGKPYLMAIEGVNTIESGDKLEDSDVVLLKGKRYLMASEGVSTIESEDRLENPDIVLPKGKRYLTAFKAKVVNYALSHSVKLAIGKFKVNRGTLSEWLAERKRQSGDCPSEPTTVQEAVSGDDAEFLSWLEESKFNLTNELIKQKAGEWLQAGGSSSKCQWLRMYAHRLNGSGDRLAKKRYITYPEALKRAVVFHAQTHSNMAAARVFGVARKRVVEWQATCECKETAVAGMAHNVTDEAVDRQVFEWYRSHETPPSSSQVRCKAVELYRGTGHGQIQCGPQWYYRWRARHGLPPARAQLYTDLRLLSWALTRLDNNQALTHSQLAAHAAFLTRSKVSRGWTFRFCREHHRLLSSEPGPGTALPAALEQQASAFRQALLETVVTLGLAHTDIIAMDEVPLHFHPRDESKKPLLIRRPGFESCQASLMVSSLADGTLLPSVLVFKGDPPTCKSDPRVVSALSETGLVTVDVMDLWLRRVCFNHLSSPCRRRGAAAVLVTDCYEAHTTAQVSQASQEHCLQQAVIPGGCAFKLLPLAQLCQLFKKQLEELCHVSLASQTRALHSPTPDQLYLWALRVHKHLAKHHKENIKTAFQEMLFQSPGQELVPQK